MKNSIHAWSLIIGHKQGKWITHIGKALGFLFYDQQFKKTPSNPDGDPNWSENHGWGFILAIQLGAIIQPIPKFWLWRPKVGWPNEWKSGNHWFTLRITKPVAFMIHGIIAILAFWHDYHFAYAWLVFPFFYASIAWRAKGIYYGVKDVQLDTNVYYRYPLDKTKAGWLDQDDHGEVLAITASTRNTRDV